VLADRLGVSRGPVRKAFQAHYASGLVKITPNRGAFVRQFTRHNAVAIHEVRARVFGTACRLPSDRITSVQIAGLRSLVARMDIAGAQRDLDANVPLNLGFPASIVNGTGNLILVRIWFAQVSRLQLFRGRACATWRVRKLQRRTPGVR